MKNLSSFLVSILLPVLILAPAYSQNLNIPISNYDNKVYGRGYEAEVWAIACDQRNIIYAGNAGGVLEYDGSSWRFIPVREGVHIASLCVDEKGRVYVGSQGEFGLLAPDESGQLYYNSLSDSLAEEDRFFSTITKTMSSGKTVYFQALENLFIYQDGEIQVIYPETTFHTAFVVNDQLYVRQRETGLMKYENGSLQPVKDGDIFANLGIFSMISLDEPGKILIATQEKGLYILDPDQSQNSIRPLNTTHNEFLISAQIYGGLKLPGNQYAFNTLREGLIITDASGNINNVINTHAGLQGNDVKSITLDKHNAIWCAMNNGISRVDYSSPYSYYSENSGITGSINTITRHRNNLYVGTSAGLFVSPGNTNFTHPMQFRAINSLQDQIWDLKSIDNELLIGSNNGLFSLKNNILFRISGFNVRSLWYSEENRMLYAAGNMTLKAFRKSGEWVLTEDFPEIFESLIQITPNPQPEHSEIELWLGTSLDGVLRLHVYTDGSYSIDNYYESDGLVSGWIKPFIFNDSLIFGTSEGALAFIDEETAIESLPDSLKDDPDWARGFFEGKTLYQHYINRSLSYLVDDANMTWAIIDNELSLIIHEQPDQLIQQPFRMIDMGEINYIFPDRDNILWLGTAEGLVRYDMNRFGEMDHELQTQIRSVVISGDSALFNGTWYSSPETPGMPALPGSVQPDESVPALDFTGNDISFRFSMPFYHNESANEYSWRLVGSRQEWTAWSNRKLADYINLREGNYEFQVRARNIYGNESPVSSYKLNISPPWYRTRLAYFLYIILAVVVIIIAVRLGQYRLRKKNERLEQIVEERTEEIRKKNKILTQQKEEIEDSIQYAEKIQRAVLPDEDSLRERLPEYFILLKPQHYVSGDFYWLADNGSRIVVAAADCTGHGVPGAFMSMLGVSFLNKIIKENGLNKADQILNELRKDIIDALKSTGKEGEQKDGMDIALCVIDMDAGQMEFAGANNPLYMMRQDELLETKPDKMPVAYYPRTDDFSSHMIKLDKGDVLYMFSDGFPDQFGGPKGKKFMYKRFKELLQEIHKKPMTDQKQILDDTIQKWMAEPGPAGTGAEQIDDILIVGVRI